MATTETTDIRRSASISLDGIYRYSLCRVWDDSLPLCSFGALNPSTADHQIDDQTIRKEIAIAKHQGFGGFLKWNLFAFRATLPKVMFCYHGDIVDQFNSRADIIRMIQASNCKTTVVCWGTNSAKRWRDRILERGDSVIRALKEAGIDPVCLGKNSDGTPKHPLYLPTETPFIPYCAEAI